MLIQKLHTKISFHVATTEAIIFKRKKKQLECDLNLKLCGKKLKPSNYVRYYNYLIWSHNIYYLNQKLAKANAIMLYKLCNFVNGTTIKSIYYAIFHSHLTFACTAWDQNLNSKHHKSLLQKKAIQMISFASFDAQKLTIFS